MAEWFKATVLKTVVPRGTVGSNPTLSSSKFRKIRLKFPNYFQSEAVVPETLGATASVLYTPEIFTVRPFN